MYNHIKMGNLSPIGKRSGLDRKLKVHMSGDMSIANEGITTIDTENYCDFSGRSNTICIHVITWNMNGQVAFDDLKKLVGDDRKFDLLVIGLQEAPRKSITKLLKESIADTHMLIGKSKMQSVQLFVFGPRNADLFLKGVKTDKYGVWGCGGLIRRKKGAVSVRVLYKGIHMAFISSHLAAHASNVEERNSQFRRISSSLFSKNGKLCAKQPQITTWLGDLNYRLEGINTFPARSLIHKNLQEQLTSKDQLLQEAERGQIFSGYNEGTLAFKPTYKYDIGTTSYDTSHKVRVPSWIDRILFKIHDPDKIHANLHSYESLDNIMSSDHRPVKAHLCLNFV